MKTIKISLVISLILMMAVLSARSEEKYVDSLGRAGVWKVDRKNHRCMIEVGVWAMIPFERKEQMLQLIYVEEKTWWEIYDYHSGKLLGKVSSWGPKIYP